MRHFYDQLPTLQVTQANARDYLQRALDEGGYRPPCLYLPYIRTLASRVSVHSLATPWEATDLDGTRISEYRPGGGLRVVERSGGKVTGSRKVDADTMDEIVASLYAGIELALGRVFDLFSADSRDQHIVYSLDLTVRLLTEWYRAPVKPRLAPTVEWPSEREIEEVVAELIPDVPWSHQDYSGLYDLERNGDEYRFSVRGERGQPDPASSFASADLAAVRRHIFGFFVRPESR